MSLFNKSKHNRNYDYELTEKSFGIFIGCMNSALIGSLTCIVGAKIAHCNCETVLVSGAAGAAIGVGARFVYDRIKENKLRVKTGRYIKK